MGAAGPAGENALPTNQTGETLTGMGAAGPAGENDLPANQTGKTLTGIGAVGPAVAARQVRPITDIAEAQAAHRAEVSGEPYRWPRDPQLVKALWVREAGQAPNSDPPAARQGRKAW
jgi:hypothetical protein